MTIKLYKRSCRLLNTKEFSTYLPPIDCGSVDLQCPFERQYVLRMMVKGLHKNETKLPKELTWLSELISRCDEIQESNKIHHPFIYITIRQGVVTSTTDDLWHVDGFSTLIPHLPEQDYIYVNSYGTEVLEQPFNIPQDFDPLKHNIHKFLQKEADESRIVSLPINQLFLFDPYIIHRRPKEITGMRTFVRISFVPIEIKDDSCTQNPLMFSGPYNREDVRKRLVEYHS